MLLSKNDAWSADGRLLKLGAVAVSLVPSTLLPGSAFATTLHVGNATVSVSNAEGVRILLWIEADSNVMNVNVSCGGSKERAAQGCAVNVEAELWRTRTRPFFPGEQAAAHGATPLHTPLSRARTFARTRAPTHPFTHPRVHARAHARARARAHTHTHIEASSKHTRTHRQQLRAE